MFAEQVVQTVAAGRGLGEQMLVIELIEVAASIVQADFCQGGGGIGVTVGPGTRPSLRNSRCWPGVRSS